MDFKIYPIRRLNRPVPRNFTKSQVIVAKGFTLVIIGVLFALLFWWGLPQ